jgi:3'(2'), 5'-bisphosphate nucleotidase
MNNKLLETAITAAMTAGKKILEIYESDDFDVSLKKDHSPLTKADKAAHQTISAILANTNLPILSEEGKDVGYNTRKNWDPFWLVDPLDGTKEFIKRNGEFTVNIALIQHNKPLSGVVYVPVNKELYFGDTTRGSFKATTISHDTFSSLENLTSQSIILPHTTNSGPPVVVGSRSHMNEHTKRFINKLKKEQGDITIISRGSALKLCMVAEGIADIYPRYAPTMEWDIAAGHAILNAAGFKVLKHNSKEELTYNKPELVNPWFLVTS